MRTEQTMPPYMTIEVKASSKWILVVSEQSVIRDVVERFFKIDGHFVSTAVDGDEGLIRARSLPIDLVVLDSDLSLSSTIRDQLKSDEPTAHLPVLWVGVQPSVRDFRPGAVTETDGLLTYPFSFAQMREAANHLLAAESS